MAIGTRTMTVNCLMCGACLKGPFVGRVPDYCSKECRELRKYLNAASRCLEEVRFDTEKAKHLRGELFVMFNQVNANRRV